MCDGLYATDRNIAAGLRYSIGRARIVNLSLAATAPLDSTAFKDSVAAGQLIVVAAGNNSLANPSWPARFAKEDWSRGRMIAVGAVDAGNVIVHLFRPEVRTFYNLEKMWQADAISGPPLS